MMAWEAPGARISRFMEHQREEVPECTAKSLLLQLTSFPFLICWGGGGVLNNLKSPALGRTGFCECFQPGGLEHEGYCEPGHRDSEPGPSLTA